MDYFYEVNKDGNMEIRLVFNDEIGNTDLTPEDLLVRFLREDELKFKEIKIEVDTIIIVVEVIRPFVENQVIEIIVPALSELRNTQNETVNPSTDKELVLLEI